MTAQWTLITLFAASATPATAGCAAPVPRLRSAAVRLSGRQCNGDGCSNRDVWSQGLTWRFSRIIINVTRLLEEYSCGGYCTPAGLAVRDRLRQHESRYYSLTLVARRPGSTRQSRPRPPLPPPFWRCLSMPHLTSSCMPSSGRPRRPPVRVPKRNNGGPDVQKVTDRCP
jgi:hypothetical protein